MSTERLIGGIERRDIRIVKYDPSWPELYRRHAQRVKEALAESLLSIEHVGSTSVPELAAKCIEVTRMLAFRDRLRRSAEDRLRYEAVKRELATKEWPDMNAYANAKTDVVESILSRAER